ncbi:MAG: hypothetical protein ACREKF_14880 [Candidatus Methylomirabilales bacterium]
MAVIVALALPAFAGETAPAPDPALWLGTREGRWNLQRGSRDVTLTVERVEGNTARVIYEVGWYGRSRPFEYKGSAEFKDGNTLKVDLSAYGAEVIFTLRPDGNLDASWEAPGSVKPIHTILRKKN